VTFSSAFGMGRDAPAGPRGGGYDDQVARLYDWEHDPYQDDIEVFIALARRFGGPVLELACGTGRLLAPLAQAGLECTGVDTEPAMLARARQRLARLGLTARLVEQDMARLQLEQKFRTILLVLDSFGLLVDQADQLAAVRAARQHATHDARLILDLSNGNLRGGGEPVEELLHHLTAGSITKWVVRRANPAEQLDQLLCFYDELEDGLVKRTVVQFRLRWFTRFELELLLDKAGWQVEELYGDYGLEPYGPTSERLIVVAR
jgi:SAM-dependent methyltransferase